jgi:hypothetical protein
MGASFFPQRGALMHLGSDLYGFGLVLSDAGETLFTVADDLSEAGTQAPITATPCGGNEAPEATVIAVKASAEDPSTGLAWGFVKCDDAGPTVGFKAMSAAEWRTLRVDPTVPVLAPGSDLPLEWGELPVFASSFGGHAFDRDDLFVVGSPNDGTGGLVHLWLSADGGVVSRAATSGKLVNGVPGNPTVAAAQFVQRVGESRATLQIAWVDHEPDHDVLWAARVTCE